ncbi:alpha/beta fold hydrolase [Mycolicibacterium sp. 120270]|uniref:alpha/beta fold hydrolase n=1 Tax=Mycolicibacterium sp. 120270 TaxID=3090600 RepID=UPI00299E7F46|nr:alpha/beta fold hydrolase [Mycolicibacterium sp. 120270]MDX1885959.1 alpha/beta fold hydrolase [Mycolicibacterium sp. 120270]
MEQFRRGDLVFDVIDAGPADGPVVVLLHGFPETNTMWQPVIERLTAQGYRCLAPLQRGYSGGARPKRRRDYRAAELVEDVRALIDESGAQRVHLVGHDWGAVVAWYVAQSHPDRLHTVAPLSVPHPAAFLKAIGTSRQALASWYMLFFQLPWIPERTLLHPRVQRGFLADRADRELGRAEIDAMKEPGALTAALNWYRAIPFSRPRDVRKKVTVPTLYVWSDDDIALLEKGAQLCADYVVGDYRFERLSGSHWIVEEHPDTVSDLLLDWFATHVRT